MPILLYLNVFNSSAFYWMWERGMPQTKWIKLQSLHWKLDFADLKWAFLFELFLLLYHLVSNRMKIFTPKSPQTLRTKIRISISKNARSDFDLFVFLNCKKNSVFVCLWMCVCAELRNSKATLQLTISRHVWTSSRYKRKHVF